ncbi:class I SAM-dependent methyltransferase [Meridianimarinicoccus aquatilis]|uniref:Class I SAM-dependent methyltransferase n=1 Tax=Meridianimarinicoccus aquatilis TaxID=2552766 RepID=A0A4R6AZY9_9RHOB|nr:SAM-dependent methyltransferase [Fluviibacterium aquatile]TDL89374.1 class I SAM-dependent methyltransferase [Fluviibacterium aquatile]
MTALGDMLQRRIAATGPITIAEYMTECLLHPEHGYYTGRDPLGAAGDFTTSPEITQMFGEMIGLALAQAWLDQGAPTAFALAELGPGRGTLMADILRVGRAVPGFIQAAEVHLVEASPVLRARQAETLKDARPKWHDDISGLPDLPLFLIANEFFDALPIRQFERMAKGWSERQVTAGPEGLGFGLTSPVSLEALAHRLADTGVGDIVETCAPATAIAGEISARIAAQGGAALIVDYGDWQSKGDTFQAVQGHQPVNPLAAPGEADLTAHVDFQALALAAVGQGVQASRMVPQGVFLESLGMTPRAQALAGPLTGDALAGHVAAHRRLTHPEEMGSLFKAIAFTPTTAPPFPGLTP